MPDERMLLSNFTSLPLALPGQTTKSIYTNAAVARQHFYIFLSLSRGVSLSLLMMIKRISSSLTAEPNITCSWTDRRECCMHARMRDYFVEPMCCSNGKGVFARSQSAIEINFNLSAAVNLDLVKWAYFAAHMQMADCALLNVYVLATVVYI